MGEPLERNNPVARPRGRSDSSFPSTGAERYGRLSTTSGRAQQWRHPMNAADVIAAFSDAMRRRGLIPPSDLIADGRLHRCRVEGAHPNKRDGAYILHLDEQPAGGFQNWKD